MDSPSFVSVSGSKRMRSVHKHNDSLRQPVVIAFNFRCYETHMFNEGELEGTMNVPMLQDPRTGLCVLDEGRIECKGVFCDGERVEEGDTVPIMFQKQHSSVKKFCFGYGLDSDEYGFSKYVTSKADGGGFACHDVGELAAWETHQGGALSTYQHVDMSDCRNASKASDDDSDDEKVWDTKYKLKLYTVLSAYKPGQTTTSDMSSVGKPLGVVGVPNWSALEAVVHARFPFKGTAWARLAVNEYLHFLELKKAMHDWASKVYAPSGAIDEVWHAHLSFVDRYQRDICAFTGGNLILHSPVLGEEPKRLYAAAYKAHKRRMTQLNLVVEKEFWPNPKAPEIDAKYRIEHGYDSDNHVTPDVWQQPSCA